MPAALILDDCIDNQEMMVCTSPASAPAESAKPSAFDEAITCEQRSSALIEHEVPAAVPADDSEVSEMDEDYSDKNQALHVEGRASSLIPAALEILNSPSAEARDLLAVMRALPWEPDIQSIACEKLWVQSFEDDQALRLAQEGGIPLVLEAMARFPNHVRLQHCAGEVLQNIASLEDAWFAHEICQRGGVTLLVHAMRNHPEHHTLQLCGCITLASLAEADSNNREHIRQSGGVDAVLYAKWNHEGQQAVLEGVQQALEALGYQDPEGRGL